MKITLIVIVLFTISPLMYAQQGGQTSSTPPLTGSTAPAGNCGVGSMFVNTTTGDLYDCNAGAWLKVNGGGSGAFSGGLGASFQDATEIAAPANPGAGNDRLYLSSATHLLACLTSSGANCMPAGGAGTVTQVTSGNFSPLFNVSVATNTTTPAFSFAGISQTQNLFFASPNGSSGVGAFRAMVAADVPASANSCAAHQFTISLASGLTVTCAQPVAADIGSIPGSSGQLLFNNAGAIGAEDPVISYSTPAESTAAWTSATGGNTAVSVNLYTSASSSSLSTVVVTLNQGSTITGGVVTFEASDTTAFTNAYNASCWQATTGSIVSTYTLAASTNQAFVCNVASYQAFRVRLSTVISGTGTINVGVQPSAGPSQPYVVTTPATGSTQTVSGTVTTTPPANASTNVVQFGGTNVSTGTGAGGAGIPRVTVSNDSQVRILGNAGVALDAATGAAPPANALLDAGLGSGATGGFLVGVPVGDTYKAINISTATTTLIVTGVSGRQVRITAQHMIAAAADNVAWIEGTGATCGTGTAGMAGGTTAASGYNFAANGGIAEGSGLGTVLQTVTTGDSVCLVTSAAVQLSGGIEYTIY
jgi:hypothetical protein